MPDGGLRDRLIFESLHQSIYSHLDSLGWFDPGREHKPIVMVDEFPDENADVAVNTLAFSMGDSGGVATEMGSDLEDHETMFFVDFFAESDALGRHVRGDIYRYLKGNLVQPVYDYTDVGDPQVFTVEIQEDIDQRKPERAVQKWQKHWYVISFGAIDYGRPYS